MANLVKTIHQVGLILLLKLILVKIILKYLILQEMKEQEVHYF